MEKIFRVLSVFVTAVIFSTTAQIVPVFEEVADQENTNLALNKPAQQSSTAFNYNASKAVDGIWTDYHFCSRTQDEENPWLVVDLEDESDIERVIIASNPSYYGPELQDFSVAIGSENVHQTEQFQEINYKLCVAFHGTLRAGEKRLLRCRRNIRGRYVKITMRRPSSLSICELEVREAFDNVALRKPAFRSSVSDGHVASRAVDGDHNNRLSDNSCAQTSVRPQPSWITVDLESTYEVYGVLLTNVLGHKREFLGDFTIAVGPTFDRFTFDPTTHGTCAYESGTMGRGETRYFKCDQPVSGRYVTVFSNTEHSLTICEFEVDGLHAPASNMCGRPEIQPSILPFQSERATKRNHERRIRETRTSGEVDPDQRIVGGSPSARNSWPWQVSIRNRTTGDHLCGGSLLRNNYIITAAHCFPWIGDTIYIGTNNKNTCEDPCKRVTVTIVWQHEEYNDRTYNNDIAIIKFSPYVTYNEAISPICLPGPDERPNDPNTQCYATGWGALGYGLWSPAELQQVQLPIVTQPVCKILLKDTVFREETMICAGNVVNGGIDSCQGDSGGPLMCLTQGQENWRLFGITSWGIECALPKRPGVFTKVTNYLQWIEDKLNA